MIEKPLVTVSGKKILFTSNLHQRITQELPQEGVEWRRRLDSKTKSVYIDVDFVDFDIDNVERSSERLSRLSLVPAQAGESSSPPESPSVEVSPRVTPSPSIGDSITDINQPPVSTSKTTVKTKITTTTISAPETSKTETTSETVILTEPKSTITPETTSIPRQGSPRPAQQCDVSQLFFNQKLLGRPILHTYWADKTDFEGENQKSQFDDWIGQVQASTCTEWAIIIIEDGDFKAQLGTALFKSKLQSSTSQANASSSSISSMSQSSSTTTSFLDRMKKGLSTIFQSDSNSDRWLTLVNQDKLQDHKAQESYNSFMKKLRSIIMASFSKQIELFEEQLRVQREMRNDKNWNFFAFFSMQEELAFAFEFLTLFDEALVQYDLLDALYTEYISSPAFNKNDEPLYEQWTSFNSWHGLCLDLNNEYSLELRRKIVEKRASLLDLRNYLFAKQCDLMLMQNQPWRVAASASLFLQNCIREHEYLNINVVPGALTCWSFISALEVLQKCECYSCTSTMENYSLHTVDIWNCARQKLLQLGHLTRRMPGMIPDSRDSELVSKLLAGLGPDPHNGLSYQKNEISPHARLKDALAGKDQFSKHLIEITELTLGTYKHIGRKRHALLVGKELADFYIAQCNFRKALPFLTEMERTLKAEKWGPLLLDVQQCISKCNESDQKHHDKVKSDETL